MARVKMPKPPKKPKQGASLEVWKRYDERVKEHEKRKKEIESREKARQAIIKKHRS
ncbi:MAG: hypothetical protein NW241_10835 [Bacteroidia bacterium]|nr:hypothetical protein [Bacteroidia bacterium]